MKPIHVVLVLGALLIAAAPAPAQQLSGAEELKTQKQIVSILQNDADLKNNRIEVRVDNGVAILKGTVDTESERAKAGELARTGGIARVDNQLDVGSRGVKETVTDSAVTAKLKAQFLANDVLRKGDISVTTNNGVVTLAGTVPSQAAHQQAVEIARQANGVRRVEDKLRVGGASQTIPSR
jgi:hyperosmotically inducible periplasmic protein